MQISIGRGGGVDRQKAAFVTLAHCFSVRIRKLCLLVISCSLYYDSAFISVLMNAEISQGSRHYTFLFTREKVAKQSFISLPTYIWGITQTKKGKNKNKRNKKGDDRRKLMIPRIQNVDVSV